MNTFQKNRTFFIFSFSWKMFITFQPALLRRGVLGELRTETHILPLKSCSVREDVSFHFLCCVTYTILFTRATCGRWMSCCWQPTKTWFLKGLWRSWRQCLALGLWAANAFAMMIVCFNLIFYSGAFPELVYRWNQASKTGILTYLKLHKQAISFELIFYS